MEELTKKEEKIVLDLVNSAIEDLTKLGIDKGFYKTILIKIKKKIKVRV